MKFEVKPPSGKPLQEGYHRKNSKKDTMKKRLITISIMLNLFAAVMLAQTTAPLYGTWKLNTAKSKYRPDPPPKSITATYEPAEGGIKAVYDGVDSEGKPIHGEFTAKFDGKDYPVTGDPTRDTIAIKKTDEYHFTHTIKKDGKVTLTGHSVISRDGKIRTLTFIGINAKGQKVNNSAVYDKQ
jgi:hypothetical protein